MNRLISILAVFAMLVVSCGKGEQPDDPSTPEQSGSDAVTGVRLFPEAVELSIGKTAQLEAVVEPETAANKTVVWSTSNDKVATVKQGLVTATGDGEAKVTATTVDGFFKASCTVVVSTIYVTEIKLTENSATLVIGEEYQINPTIVPDNAENAAIGYSVVSGDAVTVSDAGLVKAVKVGSAKVRVTALDGKGAKAEVAFTVQKEPIYATSFTLTCEEEAQVGKTVTGKINWNPSGTNQKEYTVTSSNTSVATVSASGDSFTIKALKEGNTSIKVHYTSKSGVSDKSFTFYVHANAPSIAWNCDWTLPTVGSIEDHGMVVGEKYTLSAKVSNLHDTAVIYEISSGSSYASISGSVLTASAKGYITVRAKSRSNPSVFVEKELRIYGMKSINWGGSTSYAFWEDGNVIYLRQGRSIYIDFALKDNGGSVSRQCIKASLSSNLSSYVTMDVTNYYNSSYVRVSLTGKSVSSPIKGTLTLLEPGTGISKSLNLYLCLYDRDDIKAGDGISWLSNGSLTFYDGYWRGGDIWYKNSKNVYNSTTIHAIVVWTGIPGDSGSKLRSIALWPNCNKRPTHGYAIAFSDAFNDTSDSKSRFDAEINDLSSSSSSFYSGTTNGGNSFAGSAISATQKGKYGFDMTQGLIALNANRGDSHHVTAIHHLYDSPKGGNGSYTAYNNKQDGYKGNRSVTLYPLRDQYGTATSTSGDPKDVYSSGWFIPSKEEWALIGSTLSLDHINEYLGMIQGSDKIVKTELYWTPLQDVDDYRMGIVVRGDGLGYKGLNKKDGRARLRAMMAF